MRYAATTLKVLAWLLLAIFALPALFIIAAVIVATPMAAISVAPSSAVWLAMGLLGAGIINFLLLFGAANLVQLLLNVEASASELQDRLARFFPHDEDTRDAQSPKSGKGHQ